MTTSSESNSTELSPSQLKEQDSAKFLKYRGVDCFANLRDKPCAISWTGGKDCHLALQRAIESGLHVKCCVMFYNSALKMEAHRQEWQRKQCAALQIPIHDGILEVENDNYQEAYAAAIRKLREIYDIDYIVTGDIDYVFDSTTNFMQQVCAEHVPEIRVLLPLWQQDRRQLLEEMLSKNFDIRFACVKTPYFDDTWIGRRLDQQAIAEMQTKDGLDICGENGEYHTMVVDGPMYSDVGLQFTNPTPYELPEHWGKSRGERWWVISKETQLVPAKKEK